MTFKTDKVRLGYLPTYLALAAEIGISGRVCEVGVALGNGLDMFQALFPTGLIVGVDSNQSCCWPTGTVRVIASQDDTKLPSLLLQHSPAYDLIVEDASHKGELSRRTWELLWPLVATGGYYVMEDWQVAFWKGWPDTMLKTAESFLRELATPDSPVESIKYLYGRVILKKRKV